MYINENIPSRLLKEHIIPSNIEIMCVEINLRKQKWVVVGIYRPPSMNVTYFLEHLSRVIDCYYKKYERVIVMGDFNIEPSEEPLDSFCNSFNLYNLVKDKTCFKGTPKCYDLILTNCKHSFKNTEAITTGFSDFHKMTISVLKTQFIKSEPILINYRDYKNFDANKFSHELKINLSYENSTNNNYNKFNSILREVLDKHAPIKKKSLRANNSPFMTKQLRKMIMNRSRYKNTFFKSKTIENWEIYRKARNECVKLTKKVKREYFQNLNIGSIIDSKKFWKTVKPHFSNKDKQHAKIILVEKDEIISDNNKVAEIMNDYFVNTKKNIDTPENVIESIPDINLQIIDPIDKIIYLYREHPSIMKIKEHIQHSNIFSFEMITQTLMENNITDLNVKKEKGGARACV